METKKPIANCKHCGKAFIKNRRDKVFCRANCKRNAKDIRTGAGKKRTDRRNEAYKSKYGVYRGPFEYQRHKKGFCENCGFVPIHRCQLDVDHIDGNHSNDHLENLRTLYANCHRLKTFLNKEGTYKRRNKY